MKHYMYHFCYEYNMIYLFYVRVGIKPGFYHKAQPGGFYGFYKGGFFWFYVGFINLKVYLMTLTTSCYLTVFL